MLRRLCGIFPAAFILISCSQLPFLLKDAEIGVKAIEVGLEAEEEFADEINKGNDHDRQPSQNHRP